jgi:hypothetical protein
MAHMHDTPRTDNPNAARPANAAAWILFALAAILLAVTLNFPGKAAAPVNTAGQAGTAMIEDWRGNSASITPAE